MPQMTNTKQMHSEMCLNVGCLDPGNLRNSQKYFRTSWGQAFCTRSQTTLNSLTNSPERMPGFFPVYNRVTVVQIGYHVYRLLPGCTG